MFDTSFYEIAVTQYTTRIDIGVAIALSLQHNDPPRTRHPCDQQHYRVYRHYPPNHERAPLQGRCTVACCTLECCTKVSTS